MTEKKDRNDLPVRSDNYFIKLIVRNFDFISLMQIARKTPHNQSIIGLQN